MRSRRKAGHPQEHHESGLREAPEGWPTFTRDYRGAVCRLRGGRSRIESLLREAVGEQTTAAAAVPLHARNATTSRQHGAPGDRGPRSKKAVAQGTTHDRVVAGSMGLVGGGVAKWQDGKLKIF